jgi:hypothetical protein
MQPKARITTPIKANSDRDRKAIFADEGGASEAGRDHGVGMATSVARLARLPQLFSKIDSGGRIRESRNLIYQENYFDYDLVCIGFPPASLANLPRAFIWCFFHMRLMS